MEDPLEGRWKHGQASDNDSHADFQIRHDKDFSNVIGDVVNVELDGKNDSNNCDRANPVTCY